MNGADGYELQSQQGASGWQTVATFPATEGGVPVVGSTTSFDVSTPEAIDVSFRLRATRSSETSPWSAVVSLYRGIRPPSGLSALGGQEAILLLWTQGSTQAPELVLERALVPHGGSVGAFTRGG